MRLILFRFYCCLFIAGGLVAGSGTLNAEEASKHALIVAVGSYPEGSGWAKINSANDVPIVMTALEHQGFDRKDIAVLVDNEATKQGILKAFDALTKKVRAGDIVYFHFSGHGQQIMDDNGDEVDGYDESLVPYDAGMRYESCEAKGENHIRDDYLGVLLDKIRRKTGPEGDLIVVLDACHSGTATRSIGISRGTDVKFAPPGYEPAHQRGELISRGFNEVGDDADLSPLVIFSGSSATEQNYEYVYEQTGYGSLSFAMSRVLIQSEAQTSYRNIFGAVQAKMRTMVPRQNPQLEGDADRVLFAGEAVEQQRYVPIKLWRDPQHIVIDAGLLNGIHTQSQLALYPIGTTVGSGSAAVAEGEVVLAQLSEALVKLDKPVDKDEAMSLWAFPVSFSYGNETIPVQLSKSLDKRLSAVIEKEVAKYPFLRMTDRLPELLIEAAEGKRDLLQVITRDEQPVSSIETKGNSNEEIAEALAGEIRQYAQAQLLRGIVSNNSRIALSFELVPVKLDEQYRELSRGTMDSKRNEYGQLVFEGGSYFKMRIRNNGNRMAYYSLINIQPDHQINVLIPEKDANGNPFRAASDCKIGPGKTEELKAIFYFKAPYGQEVFKLVSANRPLHLDQVFKTRGADAGNGALNPFELLFASSFDPLTRGTSAYRLPPEFVHIETLVFEVIGE